MKFLYCILSVALMATPSFADSVEDACVLDALSKVPQIPDGKVTLLGSSKSNLGGGKYKFYDVIISVQAVGKTVKYKFACRDDGDEVSIVRRLILP